MVQIQTILVCVEIDMDEEFALFDKVITKLKREWNPETLRDTISNKWDHVLIQAFFFNLGKRLGFKVGCEKFRKWDVAWVKDNNYVQVEIELRSQTPIAKAFSKICKTSDALYRRFERKQTRWSFVGILAINYYLIGETKQYKDYFFDVVLNPEEMLQEIYYPKNKVLSFLFIDLEAKLYRYAKVGPERIFHSINTKSF